MGGRQLTRTGKATRLKIVDLTAGRGTVLLAAAKVLCTTEGEALGIERLKKTKFIGMEGDDRQLQFLTENFDKLGLLDLAALMQHTEGYRKGKESFRSDVDVVMSDLPGGRKHVFGSDNESYDGIFAEAAMLLRDGGRCVMLSMKPRSLANAVQFGPWRLGKAIQL